MPKLSKNNGDSQIKAPLDSKKMVQETFDKQRPELLKKLKKDGTFFHFCYNFIVETIIDDHIIEKQSEADNNLLKFEILQKKNEFIKNNIKEINERNAKLKQATTEIEE